MAFTTNQDWSKHYLLGPHFMRAIIRLLRKNNITIPQADNNSDSNLFIGVNSSETNIGDYQPVKIGANWFEGEEEEEANLAMDCFEVTAEPDAAERFLGISQEPINAGETGIVAKAGVCKAYVDILDVNHGNAKVGASGTLESADSGPLLLISEPSATGVTLQKVIFAGASGAVQGLLRGTTNEAVTGSVGTFEFSVTKSDVPGIEVGDDIVADNWTKKTIDQGGRVSVWAHPDGQTYTLIDAECPEAS